MFKRVSHSRLALVQLLDPACSNRFLGKQGSKQAGSKRQFHPIHHGRGCGPIYLQCGGEEGVAWELSILLI